MVEAPDFSQGSAAFQGGARKPASMLGFSPGPRPATPSHGHLSSASYVSRMGLQGRPEWADFFLRSVFVSPGPGSGGTTCPVIRAYRTSGTGSKPLVR